MNHNKINKLKKIILLVIFLVLPLGYFARINLGSVFIGLYYWDVLLSGYLFLFIFQNFKNFSKFKLPVFYKILIAFIIYAGFATLSSYRYLDSLSDFVISSLYLIRWSIYMFSAIAVYFDLKRKVIGFGFIKVLIISEGLLIAIFGFLQLIFIPDFTLLDSSLLWDPHKNRLAGLYFDPNFAGIILVLALSVLTSDILNYLESKQSKSMKMVLFYVLSFLTIFTAIVLTFSRSSWLALSVSILVVGIIKYKWIIPIAIFAMFLVYYAVPRVQTRITGITDPSDSFYFRVISWTETYEVAKKNPLIGYGFNTYRYIRQNQGFIKYDEGLGDRSDAGSDSSILFVWVTTGLVGLTIFSIAHIKLFFQSLKLAKVNNFVLMFVGFQIALLVNSQFINSVFFPALAINFAIYVALFLLLKERSIED